MMKKFKVLLVVTGALLAGCSSSPDEEMAARLKALEEANQEIVAKRNLAEQSLREQELDVAPSWYLSPPDADGTGFFGVGYSKSKHMGHALKAARLQAEFALAKMYKQELSGSERAFERGNSEGDVVTQTTFLIDKIVDGVPVVGYSVVEQKMVPVNGVYETFVLLKLPYDEFNKVLQSQRERELDKTVQSAFDDLERRLASRRSQHEKEAQAAFQREQEAMKNRADIIDKATNTAPATQSQEVQPVGKEVAKPVGTVPTALLNGPVQLLKSIVGG
jgi:hypothetical protein